MDRILKDKCWFGCEMWLHQEVPWLLMGRGREATALRSATASLSPHLSYSEHCLGEESSQHRPDVLLVTGIGCSGTHTWVPLILLGMRNDSCTCISQGVNGTQPRVSKVSLKSYSGFSGPLPSLTEKNSGMKWSKKVYLGKKVKEILWSAQERT